MSGELLSDCRDALVEVKYFFDEDFPDGSDGPCAVTGRYRAAFKSIEALLPKLDATLDRPLRDAPEGAVSGEREMVEKVAETIWQAEAKRALGRRLVGWDDVAEEDREKYRFTAREVLAALAQLQLRDAPEGWQVESLHDVIVGALLEYCGTGQGVDDMLFDIASGQARGIIEAMRKFGHLQPIPSPSEPKDPGEPKAEDVTIRIQRRIDGGIRVWSEDVRGLILSGNDPVEVMADVWPALMVLLNYSSPSEPKEDKSQ